MFISFVIYVAGLQWVYCTGYMELL